MRLRSFLVAVMLVTLWLPCLQSGFKFIKEQGLYGDVRDAEDAEFSKQGWFSGTYSEKKTAYLNDHFGFRTSMIRLNNQINYSLYKKAFARLVVIGKHNTLYEKPYIDSYYGRNRIGTAATEQQLRKIQLLSDTLKSMGKTLLVVIAPGKGYYWPEDIPDTMRSERGPTNYSDFLASAAKHPGLHVLDFNDVFMRKKSTTPFPLFPKYGIHWSTYGMSLCADSIFGYIESVRNIRMHRMSQDTVFLHEASGVDYDLGDGLNLLWKPGNDPLGYPGYSIRYSYNRVKPNIMIISDSYFWNMYNNGFPNSFNKTIFWYYNQDKFMNGVAPEEYSKYQSLDHVIDDIDVVMLMASETQVQVLGWGFVEQLMDRLGIRYDH